MVDKMTKLEDLTTLYSPTWCPGCGDFGIWAAFKSAAVAEGWDNTNTCLVAGIGCHGHLLSFVKITGFEGLHGRPIPVATGIKLANHKLNVVVFTGDGDCLAEGGNHLVHGARRNHDITVVLHDNAVYGLTTGQTSPASPEGYKSKSTPAGSVEEPIYPLALAIASGATWVGRGYAGEIPKLTALLKEAVAHKGFALLDVLQPCATFNKEYTHEYFQENTYWLPESYDAGDKMEALKKAWEWGPKRIALGVVYKKEKPSYEEMIGLAGGKPTLVEREEGVRQVGEELEKFM
jgi:2-oxoglutarate ferredoxin oxidoreductase subunit beta